MAKSIFIIFGISVFIIGLVMGAFLMLLYNQTLKNQRAREEQKKVQSNTNGKISD
jgi:hypothetical protein